MSAQEAAAPLVAAARGGDSAAEADWPPPLEARGVEQAGLKEGDRAASAEGSQHSSRLGSRATSSSAATGSARPGSARRSAEAAGLVNSRYQQFMASQILASNLVPLVFLLGCPVQGAQLVALAPRMLAVLCLGLSSALALVYLYARVSEAAKDTLLTALVRLEYAQMSALSVALLAEAVTRPSHRLVSGGGSAIACASVYFSSAHLTLVLKWVVTQLPVRFMVLPEAARNATVAAATLAFAHARQPGGVTAPMLLTVLARGAAVTLAAPLLCAVCHGRTFAPVHLPAALSRSDGRAAGRAADTLTRACVRAASAILPESIMSATAIGGVATGVLFSIIVNGGFGLGFCDLCRRINAVVGFSLLVTGVAKMQAGTSTGLGMLERRLGLSGVAEVAGSAPNVEAQLAEAASEREVLRSASEAAHALFPQARAQVLVSFADDRSLRPACIEAAAVEERERGALHAAVVGAGARSSAAFVCGTGGAPVADSRDWAAGCAEFSDWRAMQASGLGAHQLVTARFTAGAHAAGYIVLAFPSVQGFASNDPATHDALRALCDCTGAALMRRRAADAAAAAAARLAHVERLAHDIFPAHLLERVANRMYDDEPAPLVEHHACVTVVFADVVNWTQRAASMTPEQAMFLLDRLWQRFDTLCSSHGVYKVEVIGDCYLAVCGMHPPRRDHAQAALRFALDLHAAAAGVAVDGEDGLSIRVGVHSGPVSSGVVGHLRQRWCIFGDTVNTASRMESSGRAGNVQLSDVTLALSGLDEASVPSRRVDIKGKGVLTTYSLEAGSPEALAARAVLEAAPAAAEDELHAELPERESLDGGSGGESEVDDAPLPFFPPAGTPVAGGSPGGPGSLASSVGGSGIKSRDSVTEADAVASTQAHAHAVAALLLGTCGPLGFSVIWLIYLSGGNRVCVAAGALCGSTFLAAPPLLIAAHHKMLPFTLSRATVIRLCLAACQVSYVVGHALGLQAWCRSVVPGPNCEMTFYWDFHAIMAATTAPLTTMLPIQLHLVAEVSRFAVVIGTAAALHCEHLTQLALHCLFSMLLTPAVIVCAVEAPAGVHDAYMAAAENCPGFLRPLRDRWAAAYLALRTRLLGATAPPLLEQTGVAVFGLRIVLTVRGFLSADLSAQVDGRALVAACRELSATLVLVMAASALSRVSLRTAGSSAAAESARLQQRLAGVLRELREQLACARSEASSLAAGCAALTAIFPGASAVAVGAFAQGTSGVLSCVELSTSDAVARAALATALPPDVGGTAGTSVHRACHSAARGAASAVLDSRELEGGLAECADWASAAAGGLEASRALTVPLTAGPVIVGFATVFLPLFHADDDGGAGAGAMHAVLREAAGVLGGALFVRRAFAINRDGDVRPAPRRHDSSSDVAAEAGTAAYPANDADAAALALLDARRAADCALLDSWSLDVLTLPEEELPRLLAAMLHSLGLFRRFQLSPSAFADFVADAATHYSDNPFHNFKHAFMVTHLCWLFLRDDTTRSLLLDIDQLTLLLAAICHDLEHPGTTNAFQVNSGSALAIRYNDASVLESHHSAVGFSILQRSRVLAGLGADELRCLRRTFVAAVLATDMACHKQLLAKVRAALAAAADDQVPETVASPTTRRMSLAHQPTPAAGFAGRQPEERSLLVSFLLHCADLGNPLRPPSLSARFADDLQREFDAQAARERAAGLPVTVMLASTDEAKAKLELGFLEFVVAPLFVTLALVAPRLGDKCVKLIAQNKAAWSARCGA